MAFKMRGHELPGIKQRPSALKHMGKGVKHPGPDGHELTHAHMEEMLKQDKDPMSAITLKIRNGQTLTEKEKKIVKEYEAKNK